MRTKVLVVLAAILPGSVPLLVGSAYAQEAFTISTLHSSGTNLSFATAQTIDDSVATNQPLFMNALIASGRRNSDTVLQGASSFTTGGQLVSPQFFPFANLNLNILGSLAASGDASENFFSFHEAAGAQIGLNVTATHPSTLGTQLMLFDSNGNAVAMAEQNGPDGLSSILDYTVPAGGDGTYEAGVLQPDVGSPAPFDYRLQFALPFTEVSGFTTNVVGGGALKNGSLGAYDVNANVGNQLSFDVHSTSPASTLTELVLVDPIGNVVADASGNGFDGLSSVIKFTVPPGFAGDWKIEVTPVTPTPYAYDLAIQGASGLGLVNPLGSPVPEPSTWMMAFVGFAGLGLVGFRRARRERAGRLFVSASV
jgi:hypothetical protein